VASGAREVLAAKAIGHSCGKGSENLVLVE
jgi:hypothetical protein